MNTILETKVDARVGRGLTVPGKTTEPTGLRKVTVPIQGMTCAACQSRVQRVLDHEPGVVDASVQLLLKQAVISYDAAVTSEASLVDAIKNTGYEATLPVREQTAFDDQAEQDRAQSAEYRTAQRKALWSGAAAVVAAALSMPLMAAHESGLTQASSCTGWRLPPRGCRSRRRRPGPISCWP
jgi:Cu+-exporting ATPase